MGKKVWDTSRNRYMRKYSLYGEKKLETSNPTRLFKENHRLLPISIRSSKGDRFDLIESEKSLPLVNPESEHLDQSGNEEKDIKLLGKIFKSPEEQTEDLKVNGRLISLESRSSGKEIIKYTPKEDELLESDCSNPETLKSTDRDMKDHLFSLNYIGISLWKTGFETWNPAPQLMLKHEKTRLFRDALEDEMVAVILRRESMVSRVLIKSNETPLIDSSELEHLNHPQSTRFQITRKRHKKKDSKSWFENIGKLIFALVCCDQIE